MGDERMNAKLDRPPTNGKESLQRNLHGRDETAVICLVLKREEAYLNEWIDYHYAIGFSHFYLYDNSVNNDLLYWQQQEAQFRPDLPYNRADITTVIHFPYDRHQNEAYRDCAWQLQQAQIGWKWWPRFQSNPQGQRGKQGQGHVHGVRKLEFQHHHTWVAFWDADEFLHMKQHDHIIDFVHQYSPNGLLNGGSLSIPWVVMGSSGRRNYSPLPVTYRFQRIHDPNNIHVKTISRINHINTDLRFLPHFHEIVNRKRWFTKHYNQYDVLGNHFYGSFAIPRVPQQNDIAVIMHFWTKSKQEDVSKRARGRSDTGFRQDAVDSAKRGEFVNNGTIPDGSLWDSMQQKLPMYKTFDGGSLTGRQTSPPRSSTASTAVCGLVTNLFDCDFYIDEWYNYHYSLGFDSFYIGKIVTEFNNYTEALVDFSLEKPHLSVIPIHLDSERRGDVDDIDVRYDFWQKCIDHYASQDTGKIRWLAFLDLDDFLILRNGNNVTSELENIVSRLQDYKAHSSFFTVPHLTLGTSNQTVYQPRPVTKRFQCLLDTDETPSRPALLRLNDEHDNSRIRYPRAGDSEKPVSLDGVVIYDYHIKSRNEYLFRKYGDELYMNYEALRKTDEVKAIFDSLPTGSKKDSTAWEAMKRLNPKYGVYDVL